MAYDNIVNVATVNFNAEWGNKAGNLARMKGYIRAAGERGANIILFPETALTGYNVKGESIEMQLADAETVPGPAANELAELSIKYGVYVVVGMPERDAATGDVYNSALAAGPQGLIGTYRKIHPAGKESMWAKKGSEPLLFDTPWGPVGVGICYDTYSFPELFRYYAALGSRLYLNPTAVSDVHGWKEYYYTLLKARVLENGSFLVSANLVGPDKDLQFPGGSLIVGPSVTPLGTRYYAEPVENEEALLLATLDLSIVDKTRGMLTLYNDNPITGVPDWRPDIYERLLTDLKKQNKWSGKVVPVGAVQASAAL
ncbi:carbon-nitrogen hydrolase family protein [Cohnella fermenti]|uniref:Carbon-nitrogen hydrolase family protein n=1 Tax=Cohnella fermenti TaxID=2565925 RepID=A0A4S4BHX1_9BACL|nr:carbon-nitrogen hydrolase family protein [Cohnella fermenti]THF74153.1 carbon-nitrogen hydrolase family protein [Cohnella fermenti]